MIVKHTCTLIGILLAMSLFGENAFAVSAVNPTGVNVNANGVTTVFLTFQGTAGEVTTDAFWCGDITVPANTVTAFDPCVPGTLFGNLAQRNNLAQASGTGGASNFTDIMTIPTSVARRAYQDAQSGSASQFFYVRRFVNQSTNAISFIAVTCRLAGGGARVPLAITDVRVQFTAEDGDRPVYLLESGAESPAVSASIRYNGSGNLKGRWEIVTPGETLPTSEDLLPEASLPVELRGSQRRYTLLERFEIFLPPTGEVTLPGPAPEKIPTLTDGSYQLLLRIESSADKEGDSNTSTGIVQSGGVAGFPMPVLRYYVGTAEELSAASMKNAEKLTLMLPQSDARVNPEAALNFHWIDIAGAQLYRLEIKASDASVHTALVLPGVASYVAPPWVKDLAVGGLSWRVLALDHDGNTTAISDWRSLTTAAH